VKELIARESSWLAHRTLGELRLRDEGVVVLGIIRADGSYEGAPRRETCVRPDDTLILYGRTGTVADIASRRSGVVGDLEHERHQID
jgi:uncharacterized protein with PhoU and TrkA domain